MIILFSSSLGVMAVKRQREKIEYIDMLIYMGNRILLLLKSTMPETDEIIKIISNDSRTSKFDLEKLPLRDEDNCEIIHLFNCLGKFDVDSQILITNEFIGYFKLLKRQYQDYYNQHYRLYIVFGIFGGILISVLLI